MDTDAWRATPRQCNTGLGNNLFKIRTMLNKNEEAKLIHQSTQQHTTNEMDAKLYIKLVSVYAKKKPEKISFST